MGLDPIALIPPDGKIIDAYCPHLPICQELRSLLRDVNKIFNEFIGFPVFFRVHRFEYDSLSPPDPVRAELGGLHRFRVFDDDNPGCADSRGERQFIDPLPSSNIMKRGIHVRSGMGAERNGRYVAHISLFNIHDPLATVRRIAGPVDHPVPQGNRDVDPARRGQGRPPRTVFRPEAGLRLLLTFFSDRAMLPSRPDLSSSPSDSPGNGEHTLSLSPRQADQPRQTQIVLHSCAFSKHLSSTPKSILIKFSMMTVSCRTKY